MRFTTSVSPAGSAARCSASSHSTPAFRVGGRLTDTEKKLVRVQDALMASAVVTGIANGVQGARLA